MRHGRSKQNRKTIQFFERTVPNIKSPYNILIDGTFIVSSITYKIPIIERLIRLLQHGNTFNLYCTSSTILELQYLLQQVQVQVQVQQQPKAANNNSKKKVSSISNSGTKRKHPDHDESHNNTNDSIVDKCIIFQQAIDFINTNCQIINVSQTTETITETDAATTTVKLLQDDCYNEFGIVQSSITKLSKTTIDVLNVLTEASIAQVQNKYTTVTNNKEQKQITQIKAISISSITNDNSNNWSSQEQDSTNANKRKQQLEQQQTDISTTGSSMNNIATTNSKQNQHFNNKYYFCASQDEDLLNIVRHITYIPIIRLARGSVLLLEQPSKYAQNAALYNEKIKWKGSSTNSTCTNKLTTNTNNDANNSDTTTTTTIEHNEQLVLDTIKQQYRQDIKIQNKEKLAKQRKVDCELYGGTSTVSEYDRRKGSRTYGKSNKRKKTNSTNSNPNPLSCKKKKLKK